MTIKQLLVGSLLGATVVATMLHRLPKQITPLAKVAAKHVSHTIKHRGKSDSRISHRSHPKETSEVRISLSKVFD